MICLRKVESTAFSLDYASIGLCLVKHAQVSISDTGAGGQGNTLYTKTREMALMRVGSRKGGAGKVGVKGNFSCDCEESERNTRSFTSSGDTAFFSQSH